jgi:hypothetical protein
VTQPLAIGTSTFHKFAMISAAIAIQL